LEAAGVNVAFAVNYRYFRLGFFVLGLGWVGAVGEVGWWNQIEAE